ncbi:MAG: RnfABCDGE type electron transport complex subunit A [Tenericutes bacterium]|nr:RnfABCDGE type electron transport complex subunit A [Mycoplasmatota bacterium]MCK5731651.1 RnfABCDGE type electron transport complex subunit A [Mycoplasmatota bacterium]
MENIIALAFTAFIAENIILSQFLGICPFLGVSKKRSSALGMGFAVLFVMIISSIVTWVLYKYVLEALDIQYMRTIVFIIVIASLVQMVETFIKKVSPGLYKALGIYLPLITTNCAVLGVAILNISKEHNFGETIVYTTFIGLGFVFVMFIFSMMREKIDKAPVPKAFQGIPIALIVAAILAIIFSRFGGIF